MNGLYLGIDVGSISTDLVLMRPDKTIEKKLYLRTHGDPVGAVAAGLGRLFEEAGPVEIAGVGATGSGRAIAAGLVGADEVKNEITAHAVAAVQSQPDVRTVLEIGGQDSKIIFLDRGVVTDFNMNTVCAAGTGSFLDRQAARMGIRVEDIGALVQNADRPCQIAGRCAVFAESDMIHKQQEGLRRENILAGLCKALVRNYLSNLCAGKTLQGPILFQGGVAANSGIAAAFREALQAEIIIPPYYDVMGAWGAAILALEHRARTGEPSRFKGAAQANGVWQSRSETCRGCANRCSVSVISLNGSVIGKIGNRCENVTV